MNTPDNDTCCIPTFRQSHLHCSLYPWYWCTHMFEWCSLCWKHKWYTTVHCWGIAPANTWDIVDTHTHQPCLNRWPLFTPECSHVFEHGCCVHRWSDNWMPSFHSYGTCSHVLRCSSAYGYEEWMLGNAREIYGFGKMLVCYTIVIHMKRVLFLTSWVGLLWHFRWWWFEVGYSASDGTGLGLVMRLLWCDIWFGEWDGVSDDAESVIFDLVSRAISWWCRVGFDS